MSQFKKDEILEMIKEKALLIFASEGYLNTKMTHIAESAGISVGNIYTYFNNKEELFYAVVPEDIVRTITDRFVGSVRDICTKHFEHKLTEEDLGLTDEDMDFFITYRRHLLIIFEKNAGTKYENADQRFIETLIEAQRHYFKREMPRFDFDTEDKNRIIQIVIRSMLNTILEVMRVEVSDNKRREYFRAVEIYRLHGLYGLLE